MVERILSDLLERAAARLPMREIVGVDGSTFLERYKVLDLGPALGRLFLHRFRRGDEDRELHNHPWWGLSLVLVGGYLEERRVWAAGGERVETRRLRPGALNLIASPLRASSDTRPPWPYTPRVALSADSPVSLVLAARTLPETRAEALAELRRRLTLAGPSCASPGALSAAVGIGERTLRRVLDELDAEGPAVPVGWTRSRGGGMARARAGRARKIAANPRT